MNYYQEAMRYIRCNLPGRKKEVVKDDKIEVYFNYNDRAEFIFYLCGCDNFKRGDIVRNNPSLGYYPDKASGSFSGYDYEAARKWDLDNAGIELSPSY